ncbi:MAG TPA: tetratricopeptide repeat protein [Gemmatimonadaceae bacterium]|nr:tetratricopeptide repeat protein [Gemmatimonadaceae bacterium]
MTSFGLDDPVLHQARMRAGAGAWREVASLLEGQCEQLTERPERLTLYAEALLRCGEPQHARACLEAATPLLERTAHRGAHRTALNLLGAASFAVGALDEAQAAWDRLLELAQQTDDVLLLARATNNLGAIANLRGARHDALRLYNLAVPVYQRLGELRGLAETFHNLAMTYRDLGDLTQSDEYERRAMDYAREAGAPRLAIMAQVGRAEVALRSSDFRLASATATYAAADAERHGDFETAADAYRCAGEAETALGNHAAARRLLSAAAAHTARGGPAIVDAEVTFASAVLAFRTGDRDRARRDASHAAEAFDRLGAGAERQRALDLLLELDA